MLTLKDVKEKLHNKVEFGFDLDEDLRQEMKESGIIIVYGYSDDLMEFDGAFYDEAGVYDGGVVNLREMNEKFQDIDIIALWCQHDDYEFVYETEIFHETFDVLSDSYDDRRNYCRGIIFYEKDVLDGRNN
jgi:hypothetical protein